MLALLSVLFLQFLKKMGGISSRLTLVLAVVLVQAFALLKQSQRNNPAQILDGLNLNHESGGSYEFWKNY